MIEVERREKQQGKVEGAVSISKQYLYNFSIIKEYNSLDSVVLDLKHLRKFWIFLLDNDQTMDQTPFFSKISNEKKEL